MRTRVSPSGAVPRFKWQSRTGKPDQAWTWSEREPFAKPFATEREPFAKVTGPESFAESFATAGASEASFPTEAHRVASSRENEPDDSRKLKVLQRVTVTLRPPSRNLLLHTTQ